MIACLAAHHGTCRGDPAHAPTSPTTDQRVSRRYIDRTLVAMANVAMNVAVSGAVGALNLAGDLGVPGTATATSVLSGIRSACNQVQVNKVSLMRLRIVVVVE